MWSCRTLFSQAGTCSGSPLSPSRVEQAGRKVWLLGKRFDEKNLSRVSLELRKERGIQDLKHSDIH